MESDESKFCRKFATTLILTVFDTEFYELLRSLNDMPFLPEGNVLDLKVVRIPNVDIVHRYDLQPSKEVTENGVPCFMTLTIEYFKVGKRKEALEAYDAHRKQEQQDAS